MTIKLITPIKFSDVTEKFEIVISASKTYDPDYTEYNDAILVNSTLQQLTITNLTPDTQYIIRIVSLDTTGLALTTTSVTISTTPGGKKITM